jgi:hypothetical protein
VNHLNIGLMILSCLLAYIFPFELFLLSYAVLGPLHYLTEISWLHDRGYFAGDKKSKRGRRVKQYWLSLVLLTTAVLAISLVAGLLGSPISPKWEMALFYAVFITALLLTQIQNRWGGMLVVSLAILWLLLFNNSRYYAIIALFLATIIHVLIFTGAFILFGALKSRSASGIISLIVFILCVASFFVYAPDAAGHTVGDYVRNSYRPFNGLNAELIKLFQLGTGISAGEIYDTSAGLAVMRLIAFAYTYHYLNWFSKTSIIKWHEVPRRRTILIIALWVISLAVYASNYEMGMSALYFLSILHVMLEFPLNYQTFTGIGRELYAMTRYRRRLRQA